jgi:hypothetical protein
VRQVDAQRVAGEADGRLAVREAVTRSAGAGSTSPQRVSIISP